jgi:hypothetical protein
VIKQEYKKHYRGRVERQKSVSNRIKDNREVFMEG